jgi:hypothetical protein
MITRCIANELPAAIHTSSATCLPARDIASISDMEDLDEIGSLMPICPFLLPYVVGIENKMLSCIVDGLNWAVKLNKNPFQCDRESVALDWRSSAGLYTCLSL